jgi:hypothetical protein
MRRERFSVGYSVLKFIFSFTDKESGISQAYQILKDPAERKKYDADNKGGYAAPPMDADDLYQEEFHENAFGDDSASEEDDTDDQSTQKSKIKPNDAHKKIYASATPFIQSVLANPPTTDADKKARAEQVQDIHNKVAEQNKKDGLEDGSQCQISYVIFESTAILASPYVARLKANSEDTQAKEWVKYHDSSLALVNRQNGYPKTWTLKDSIFPERSAGGADQGSGSGGRKKGPSPAGANTPSGNRGADTTTPRYGSPVIHCTGRRL